MQLASLMTRPIANAATNETATHAPSPTQIHIHIGIPSPCRCRSGSVKQSARDGPQRTSLKRVKSLGLRIHRCSVAGEPIGRRMTVAYRHVGQRNLAVTANTYTHVLGDETELDDSSLLGSSSLTSIGAGAWSSGT